MASNLTRLATRSIAAAASRQIASRVSGAQLGPIGTVATIALPFLLRRVSPMGMVAMAVGAWGIGKLAGPVGQQLVPPQERKPVVTPPPIAWAPAADVF